MICIWKWHSLKMATQWQLSDSWNVIYLRWMTCWREAAPNFVVWRFFSLATLSKVGRLLSIGNWSLFNLAFLINILLIFNCSPYSCRLSVLYFSERTENHSKMVKKQVSKGDWNSTTFYSTTCLVNFILKNCVSVNFSKWVNLDSLLICKDLGVEFYS